MSVTVRPRFGLGMVLATPGALSAVEAAQVSLLDLLQRHQRADWGNLDAHDKQENEIAVKHGYRIISSYSIGKEVKVWVITEADRSCTTLILPSEY